VGLKGVGFIGGGRIVRILLGGLDRAERLPSSIVVSDCDPSTLTKLRTALPAAPIVEGGNDVAAGQPLVFLALHPPALSSVLPALRTSLRSDAILISLAPRWTIARIAGELGGFSRIARSIPNAPSIVNHGYNPLALGGELGESDHREILGIFSVWGACPVVPEFDLEAYAILTAMGPTYLWYQLYQLTDLALSFGLTPEAVQPALRAMLEGTVRTMEAADLAPEAVLDLIPVRPLAEIESAMREAYVTNLSDLYRRLKA
jgi:pyrroline-5-carboxylate reductase